MIHRIGRRKYKIGAMDFETHNDEESIAKQETSVWLAVLIMDENATKESQVYYYNIKDFIDALEKLVNCPVRDSEGKRQPRNTCIYDYNLSFEWSFILPELLRRGFKYKERINDEDEFVYNSVSTKSVSSVWSIEIKFGKKSGILLLRDLAKIYGGGLRKVAKAFNLPTQKGDIDYRLNRLHDYKVTDEEREYCFNDVKIIVEILEQVNGRGDSDFWNSSSASSYSMRKLIKRGYPRAMKPYSDFRKEYPELGKEETEFLRHSVGGGITYAPKLWQFKEINRDIIHIDMHQAHPTSAYSNRFPYGVGEYHKGKPEDFTNYINCCHVRVSYSDVRLHSIIQLIGVDFIDGLDIWLWDFELPTMFKCYVDLEIEFIDYYKYNRKPLRWRQYYADNYRARKISKEKGDEFGKLYYKLLNNSSYGKLLERPHNAIIANTINSEGIIDSLVIDKAPEDIALGARYTYLPVGSCIPAYTRVRLIETALLFGWENITYFDTDSIFIIKTPETWKIWEEQINKEDFLGGWGLEAIHNRAQFTAPKRYKTETDGRTEIKAGGINFDKYIEDKKKELNLEKYEVTFDEINIVSSKWQVQRAYRVKGGTLIEFQTKEMSIADKYINIYNKNKEDNNLC